MTDAASERIAELAAVRPFQGAPERLRAGDDPRADALLQRIVGTPLETPNRRRRRPRRWFPIVVIGLTTVTAGTAAAVWLTRSPDDPEVITCYSSTEVDDADIHALVREPGIEPARQCEAFWSSGGSSGGRQAPEPPLVACVTDAGTVAVVPGTTDTCEMLGWSILADDVVTDTTPGVGLSQAIFEEFGDRCLDRGEAERAARRALDRAGLPDWQVTSSAIGETECGSAAPIIGERRIDIVALPKAP